MCTDKTAYLTNSNEELSSVQLPLTTISAIFARYPSTGSKTEPPVTPTTTCGQHESSLVAIKEYISDMSHVSLKYIHTKQGPATLYNLVQPP